MHIVCCGHRRTSQGGCSPPDSGNSVFFGQKLNFSGRSQQPKMKKMHLLNEKKTEFIPSSEIKCPIPGFLLTITGWGESGKVILQVSVAVFSGAAGKIFGRCRKIFRAQMSQPP